MKSKGCPVMCIILSAVLPLSLKTWAHFQPEIRCDRHIAEIEKLVEVRTQ
jgi:hypothetical protein